VQSVHDQVGLCSGYVFEGGSFPKWVSFKRYGKSREGVAKENAGSNVVFAAG